MLLVLLLTTALLFLKDSRSMEGLRSSTDLVGVRTRQKMPYGSSDSFCRTGSTNAAVFPLPVFAQPMQSRPERVRTIRTRGGVYPRNVIVSKG